MADYKVFIGQIALSTHPPLRCRGGHIRTFTSAMPKIGSRVQHYFVHHVCA